MVPDRADVGTLSPGFSGERRAEFSAVRQRAIAGLSRGDRVSTPREKGFGTKVSVLREATTTGVLSAIQPPFTAPARSS
jgi:hypothetical protein